MTALAFAATGYSIVTEIEPEIVMGLRHVAQAVELEISPALISIAQCVNCGVVTDPVHAVFSPLRRRRSWVHSWKLVDGAGAVLTVELAAERDGSITGSVNGRVICGAKMGTAAVAPALARELLRQIHAAMVTDRV